MTVKVGDKIRITGAFDTSDLYENGEILTVADFDSDGDVYVSFAGYGEKLICAREFEVISNDTDVKLAELEGRIAALEATQPSEQQAPPLKVGDYAKVIDDRNFEGDKLPSRTIGEIVKIEKDDGSDIPYRTEDGDWYRREALVLATDEDFLAAKFAEIGRKPGEFKAGDIVKVVDPYGTFCLKVGQITEVVNHCESGAQDVRSNDGDTRYAIVELITPVERRFDR